jgi:methionyl-tRNA formyltransferase
MTSPRIIFMGTPTFAVATLDAMVSAGIDVVGVVTAPDRPAGRGRQLRCPPVKERALELGLPLLQPDRLKDPAFHADLDALNGTLYVVVAFRMLPEVVWARPALGTVNLHASLLPDYRGAAPINWAIINGEERTGVTTFLIRHEIDTGDILLQEELSIGPDETAGELHDRMMIIGAGLMVRTVHGLTAGSIASRPQQVTSNLHNAPKIDHAACHLDFAAPMNKVHDLVRGMSPLPGAWCTWTEEGRQPMLFKLLRTSSTDENADAPTGHVRFKGDRMFIACADRWIEAVEIQPEGKRRMNASEFVRGIRPLGIIVMR